MFLVCHCSRVCTLAPGGHDGDSKHLQNAYKRLSDVLLGHPVLGHVSSNALNHPCLAGGLARCAISAMSHKT